MANLIRIPAVKKQTSTIILLHGLGDSGEGWKWLADSFKRQSKFENTAFIFPSAPTIPITVNMGMRMPGWYDISGFDDNGGRDHDEKGVLESQSVVHKLIDEEVQKGIPANRIVLGGFSQGGAMSIVSGSTYPGGKLAGIFSLSGYLLLQHKFRDMIPEGNANQVTPIFMGHGISDPLVALPMGRKSAEKLKDWGRKVEFNAYPDMGHEVCPQELADLERFLKQSLPEVDAGGAGSAGDASAQQAA